MALTDAHRIDGADEPDASATVWKPCDGAALPPRDELQPLPGGGEGPPVVTSNNPEVFTSDGLLFGTARASVARGGAALPLAGRFGVYAHHINGTQTPRALTVLVTNPGPATATVSARGSGYTQDETGGLPLGGSPDYRVSEDWILDQPRTTVPPTELAPYRPLILWQGVAGPNREIDLRLDVESSAPIYIYVVATASTDINDVLQAGLADAAGHIASPGETPPPFGREAGVYAHDTWRGHIAAQVPGGPSRASWWVNTATGAGAADVQAFPATMHYADSAREAVGMYGNVYDLELVLEHDGADANPRAVTISLGSLGAGSPSRFWDGVFVVDGAPVVVQNTPARRRSPLASITLSPGETRGVRLRAMVPGLTSIPQALIVESNCP